MQQSATPLPTALLPTEVIEEVIDQASDDHRTLRRLALLCKSMLPRSRFHLFTTIVIRSVQQLDSSSEFLDSHLWVLPLVQKVILSAHIPDDYSKPHFPLLDMIRVHLFTRLPNLRVWQMRRTYNGFEQAPGPKLSLHRSTLLCYRTYGSRIQSLQLANICIQGVSHFVRFISAFTSLQSLICSEIVLPDPKEGQTSLHASQLNPNSGFKFVSKPLTIRHLSVAMSVDNRLVEYLLSSSQATLAGLSLTLCSGQGKGVENNEMETYSERLEGPLNRLSKLSILKLVISGTSAWEEHDDPSSPVERILWATRILKRVRKPSPLRDVQVQFDMRGIADLGGALYGGLPAQLEPCSELEDLLLTFPSCSLRICWLAPDWRGGERPEFWSPTIRSAFPKLNERGLLSLPYTRPSYDPFGHKGAVTCLVASKDNRRIMTTSTDGTVIVWDTELGIIEQQWFAHRGIGRSLGVSPNNQCVVSAGGNNGESLIVWDISNGVRKVAVLASVDPNKKDETMFIACAWSPNGTLIASGRSDRTVHIWDALTFQPRGLLPIDNLQEPRSSFPMFLQWSADSQHLAWTSAGPLYLQAQWTVWGPLAEEPPRRLPSHPTPSRSPNSSLYGFRFDPKGKYAVAALGDRRLYNSTGSELLAFREDGSSDGPRPGYIHIRDVATGAMVAHLEHARGAAGLRVCFSPDGRSLLSVSRDGSMKIWDTEDWRERASLKTEGGQMTLLACIEAPNGGYYVAAVCGSANDSDYTWGNTVRLWRLGEASQYVAVSTRHEAEVDCLEFSSDGKFLASGDRLGIVHIHRLSNFVGSGH